MNLAGHVFGVTRHERETDLESACLLTYNDPMQTELTYIPEDRRFALAQKLALAPRSGGTALFADISGFTALTEALASAHGPRAGADEATRRLNEVYDAIIEALHRFGGSIISFSGDGMLCWFAEASPYAERVRRERISNGKRAQRACRQALCAAFAVQQVMQDFVSIPIDDSTVISLGIKTSVASGEAHRFVVGDATIQRIDVLAGSVVDRTSAAEQIANQGETLIDEASAAIARPWLEISEWRSDSNGQRFAVVEPAARLQCGNDGEGPVERLTDVDLPAEQARQWLLPAVSAWLSSGQSAYLGELRPACALFIGINGLDTEHDPDIAKKLNAYVCWVQQTLSQVEAELIQVTIGDKGIYLFAAFGAPVAHSDDLQRAAWVARYLQEPPSNLPFRPLVQIGMAQGRMRMGAYGSESRRTFGVQGPAVNLAAALMTLAQPGQILLNGPTSSALTSVYFLEDVGHRQVKGQTSPIPVYALGTAKRTTPIPYDSADGQMLYGRSEALSELMRAATALERQQGAVVRIEGEAGIGKSRLIAAFADRLKVNGLTLAAGAGRNIERNTPYLAARQMARWLLGLGPLEQAEPEAQIVHITTLLESLNPQWLLRLPLLGDLLDLPIPDNATTATFDPQLRRAALLTLTVEIIQTVARTTPLALLVEDAQWLDEASLDMLAALARVIEQTPMVLIIVHRPAEQETAPTIDALAKMSSATHLILGGLDRAGMRSVVELRLGGAISPLALDLIERQAQGNPFFCQELVDTLLAAGEIEQVKGGGDPRWALSDTVIEALRQARALVRLDGEWRLAQDIALTDITPGLPDSIHGAVLARFDRMNEQDKLTLKVASVIGQKFPAKLVATVHPTADEGAAIMNQLEGMTRQNLVRRAAHRDSDLFEFSHNITQEVIYRLLLKEQRQELHTRVGEALEQMTQDRSDLLAHHFFNGKLKDSSVHSKALVYLDLAARRARLDYANEAALFYLDRALGLEARWQWLADQTALYHLLGRRNDEQASLERLTRVQDAPPIQLALARSAYFEAISAYQQAVEQLEMASDFAMHDGDHASHAHCLAQLGLIAWKQGDLDTAERYYRSVLAALPEDGEFRQEKADARYGLGLVYRQQGSYDAALAEFSLALATYRALENRQSEAKLRIAIGHVENRRNNLADALDSYREGLELYRMIGDRAGLGAGLVSLAQGISATGDLESANQLLAEAREIHQALGDLWWQTIDLNELAINAMLVGRLEEGGAHLQVGLSLSREIGDESGIAYALCNLGQIRRDQGLLEEAEALMVQGIALARHQADTVLEANYLMDMALISQARYRDQEAIERARASSRLYTELDLEGSNLTNLTTMALCSLRIGDDTDARRFTDEAVARLQMDDGASTFPQREYLTCATVYRGLGHAELADECLRHAHRLVEQQAEKLQSEALRRSYLEKLPFNRQILDEVSQAER